MMMKPFEFKNIKKRLTFWFLVVALLPLTVVSVINYCQRVASIEKRAFETLAAIRDIKINELEKWLEKKFNDLHTAAQDPEVRAMGEFMRAGHSPGERPELLRSVRESLDRFIDNYFDNNELLMIDAATGRVAIATDRGIEGADRSDNPYFTEPMATGRDYIKDIFFSQALGKMSMTFSTPIFESPDRGGRIAAVLVLRVFLENSVYALLLDRSGLGHTGETFLVNDEGLALTPLRHSSQAPLHVKIDTPASRLARTNKTGIMESVDYRGERVLTAYGHAPMAGWGVVVKQDARELNTPINATLFNFVLMMLFSFAAVYGVASLLSRAITRPVEEMTEVSRRIQAGDMGARNTQIPADEFGFLAQSFNRMADSLMYQMEMQKAEVQVNESMLSAFNLKEFSMALQHTLIELTDSNFSAFYIRRADRSRFDLYTSIGLDQNAAVQSFDADRLEGEFGRILIRKDVVHQTRIPENTPFTFKTVAGAFVPGAILAIPLKIADEVMGVIALAGLGEYSTRTLELMNRSWVMAMNASFANFTASEETRVLAAKLNVINNELKAKAAELAFKTETLERQSVELRETNRELDTRRIEVEQANRMKSQFLSNMSHELRTPLNSVMALSRVLMLQAGGKLTAEEKNYLEIIARNGRSLLELINDILELSKIESGRMDVKIKRFPPRSVVELILERLAPIAAEKGILLSVEFAEDLPVIESDETRLHHILQNIVGNAVKFTEDGGVTVNAYFDEDEDALIIEVADTGIGIPENELPHLFDEFRQVDGTSTRRYEGTGLGLAIARKSAEMLGGRISVLSEVGRGSIFTLVFPRRWREKDPEVPVEGPPSRQPDVSARETILVVDDDPETVALLSGFLYSEGFEVITALTGRSALETARRRRPGAITLDLLMPEMDGIEVLQGLKNDPVTRDIPVIIVSVSEDRATGFALGAVGYMTKPVTREKLAAELTGIREQLVVGKTGIQVLVVDDSATDRMEMARIVEDLGLKALTAENGARCLEMMERQVPDILLLDLIMPEMDGFRVLDCLIATPAWRNIPVIVVTAKDLTSEDARQLNDRAAAVIGKSAMASAELLTELKTILRILPSKRGRGRAPDNETLSMDGQFRILVIEDNPDNMTAIRAILNANYRLLEAGTGDEGLDLALAAIPDLILLDMALPGMDGMSVIREIRAHPALKNIPVIALTAQAMPGDREKMIHAGCSDYLAKPFHPEELLAKTASWIKPGKE